MSTCTEDGQNIILLQVFRSSFLDHGGHILSLDIADLSDHGPVMALKGLKFGLVNGQVSFTSMEHGTPHA